MSEVTKTRIEKLHACLCILAVIIFACVSFYFGQCLLPIQSSIWRSYPQSGNDILKIDEMQYKFSAFIKKYQKKYDVKEYHQRFENFKISVLEIEKLNQDHGGTAEYGLTKFADMTPEEFKEKMLMDPKNFNRSDDINKTCETGEKKERKSEIWEWKDMPQKFDWRHETGLVVGPVLDQGKKGCWSCWAHSIVGVMESMVVIDKLAPYSRLSIEELLQCSNYTEKCTGGNVVLALRFLCDFRAAIIPEADYPLKNEMNGKCKLKYVPQRGVKVSRMIITNDVNPEKIAWAVATHGPVVAIVNALPWQYYLGGVIQYHCSGRLEQLHHVVQIVGYDFTTRPPHFIIRNSWGTDWGDNGYIYIAMSGDYLCGIGRQIANIDVAIV